MAPDEHPSMPAYASPLKARTPPKKQTRPYPPSVAPGRACRSSAQLSLTHTCELFALITPICRQHSRPAVLVKDTHFCVWKCCALLGPEPYPSFQHSQPPLAVQVVTVEPGGLSSNHAKKLRLLLARFPLLIIALPQ